MSLSVFFLSADRPICKEYELDDNNDLIKHPYPFVYEVTSHEEHPTDLQAFERLIQKYAAKGATLVKGKLARPLVSESRKGSTDSDEKTDWICLDLDGIENYQDIDQFLEAIGVGDTDYVIQWSSSMGIENKAGFRCHVFMLLDKPQHPQLLKHWLQHLNLTILNTQLELTKTGNSLRWPLDITTCQNDKLLYIAPPILDSRIPDPFVRSPRIAFVPKTKQRVVLPYPLPSQASLREATDKKIEELRTTANLPKRKKAKYKFSGTTEYMVAPDSCTITEMKHERGFVYFNLNGGDSWAYYHPEDNPKFIHNFKGEPTYRTEDLLPEYWARIQQATAQHKPNSKGVIYFAFRDFKSSNYFNGWYNTQSENISYAMAKSESQIRQFMAQHGQPLGDFIPDWDLVWLPHSTQPPVDVANQQLNTYQQSEFYTAHNPKKPAPLTAPPTILKVIDHVLGHDQPTIDAFINWLACVVQYKNRTGTGWVWQGTQGTGKGVLFHKVLTPLMAEQNVVSKRMEELESEFTGFMENKFIVFIDEIESGKSLYHDKITAKLKNLIVEPTISIRKMYTPAYMAPNYSNMIFASNKPSPVEVAPDDRRFNIGPYQDNPIQLTSTEIDDIIPLELQSFFDYLMGYPADLNRARKPLISTARTNLIAINQTAIDTVAQALLNGDLEFFWDHLLDSKKQIPVAATYDYTPYRDLIVDLVQNPNSKLTRDELHTIFHWCVGRMPQSPNKFAALLKHHRVNLTQVWKHNRNVRGIDIVNWQFNPAWHAQALIEIANGAV